MPDTHPTPQPRHQRRAQMHSRLDPELLPCPFCSGYGYALAARGQMDLFATRQYRVGCLTTGCRGNLGLFWPTAELAEARRLWNRREAAPALPQGVVERDAGPTPFAGRAGRVSRIDVVGQNGNDGLHYDQGAP